MVQGSMVTPDSFAEQQYRPHEDVATEAAGSDLLLVQLVQGTAFRLNATGAAIWELAADGLTATEIAERLHQRFGAPIEQIRNDARQLLEELAQSGLLEQQPKGNG